jgi:hypothetical protein
MVEERDSGLNSLSLASQNPRLLEHLLAEGIVRTAGPLLLDNSAIVRHSAAGALRYRLQTTQQNERVLKAKTNCTSNFD